MLGGISQIQSKVGEGTWVEVKIPRTALAGRSNDVEK
jgi:chemotaxis protein histidine kinase CheA